MVMRRLLGVVLLVALFGAGAASATAATFSGTYASERWLWWAPRDCGNTAGFIGEDPDSPGRHPVFIYEAGTSEPYDGPVAHVFLDAMAARGFVAASVQYEDWELYADGLKGNAACIYGAAPQSAIAQICARPAADCSQGIVVAGFSQGAVIQSQARNYDPRVRAAYLLGYDEERSSPWEGTARWTMAMPPPVGTRALPDGRLRIVNGQTDSPPSERDELDDLTGRSCATSAFHCLAPGGSGWYVVRNRQVADGFAEHCYFEGGWSCPYGTPPFDPTWLHSTTAPWALAPNLDWLQSFTGAAG